MAEIKDFPEKPVDMDKSFIEVCDLLAKGIEDKKSLVLDFVRNGLVYSIIVRKDLWGKK